VRVPGDQVVDGDEQQVPDDQEPEAASSGVRRANSNQVRARAETAEPTTSPTSVQDQFRGWMGAVGTGGGASRRPPSGGEGSRESSALKSPPPIRSGTG